MTQNLDRESDSERWYPIRVGHVKPCEPGSRVPVHFQFPDMHGDAIALVVSVEPMIGKTRPFRHRIIVGTKVAEMVFSTCGWETQ